MREFVSWWRSIWCKHTWEREERTFTTSRVVYPPPEWQFSQSPRRVERDEIWVSATCTKCGLHKSYEKFGD